jgi:hypothetical protein
MEFFKAEIKATKENAKSILDLMENSDVAELTLEDVPLDAISDFISDKRSNVWEITVNDKFVMEVVASNKKSAKAMAEMVKEQGGKTFPLAPIPIQNLLDFTQGKRSNVLNLEMVHRAPGEELPGHV